MRQSEMLPTCGQRPCHANAERNKSYLYCNGDERQGIKISNEDQDGQNRNGNGNGSENDKIRMAMR